MSNPYGDNGPYGENEQGDQRPQPRYGAYAPNAENSAEPTADASETGGQHNPYGQPAWGQPGAEPASPGSSGQQGPYAAAPGEPSASPAQPGWQQAPPPGGYPGSAVTHKPKRPTTLVISMVLMLAAGALSLIWGIYVMVSLQAQDASALMGEQMRDAMVSSFQNDPQLQDVSPEEALDMALLGIGVFALIWAVVLLAVYVALAFVGTMTGNVGRVLATIWLTGSLLFLLLGYDGASFSIIGLTVLASIAALVLLWLPASNDYMHQRRAFKDAQRYQQHGGYPGGPSGPVQQGPYTGTNPYA